MYLEIFLLNLYDDPDGLRVDLDHISELKLAQAVHTRRHVRAELQILRK